MTKTENIQFPSEFHLKAIGLKTEAFEQAVLAIARQHVPDLAENSLRQRPSAEGKYLALSIDFTARSQAQLDALYEALNADPNVRVVL